MGHPPPGYPGPTGGAPPAGPPYGYPPPGAPFPYAPPSVWPPGAARPPSWAQPTTRRRTVIVAVALAALAVLAVIVIGTTTRSPRDPFVAVPVGPASATTASGRPLIGTAAVFHLEGAALVATALTSGEPLWRTDTGCGYADWADPARTAATDVLVLSCGGSLRAFDATTGTELWRAPLDHGQPDFTRTSSAAIVLGHDRDVVVLDPQTGHERWRHAIPPSTFATNPVETDATAVYVSELRSLDGKQTNVLAALDPQTGRDRWVARVSTAAVMATDAGLFVRTDGHSVARVDPDSGTVRWTSTSNDPDLSWAMIVGATDDIVVARDRNGVLSAYDPRTGTKRWVHARGTTTPASDSSVSTSQPTTTSDASSSNLSDTYAAVGDGRVVVTGSAGLVVLDDATGAVVHADAAARPGRASVASGQYAFVDGVTGRVVTAPSR